MKQRHDQIHAYVLHTRPFRETSLLIEFFTEKLGRCSAIARGAYSGKSPIRLILQAFQPLSISLQGSTELLTLTKVERLMIPPLLEDKRLVCGLYLNELLYHTLHRYDPHADLFFAYIQALAKLHADQTLIALREFEMHLLESLGYGIHFETICTDYPYYRYDPHHGFTLSKQQQVEDVFPTEVLLAIAAKNWVKPKALGAARVLTRIALAPLLAGKEIYSRALLQ